MRLCSCICAGRQSLPIRRIVGQSWFFVGKLLARSEKSGIASTSSRDGTLSICEGMLCWMIVGGNLIEADPSSGLTVNPLVILQGVSVDVPCIVIVASLEGCD